VIGPQVEEPRPAVEAWLRGSLLLEKYRYAPGPAEELPKHPREAYQICLSLNFPGVYGYRGTKNAGPVSGPSVVNPGEVHSARDPQERLVPSSFRMTYAEPSLLAEATTEVSGRGEALPVFRDRSSWTGAWRGTFCGCPWPSKAPPRGSNRTSVSPR
jgi:hypothetical protein